MNNETEWIQSARGGDQAAFGRLVVAYQTPVYNLAYRMLGNSAEAEEAAQEAFLRAFTRFHSYNPQRPFRSWMLSIASHYCIDRLRRRRFSLVSWDDLPPWRWLPDADPQPEEVALRNEEQREIQELLNQLPPDYRAAVILRYWHELSYEEIAEALDSTLSAIKSRLFRARQMMAEAAAKAEAKPTGRRGVYTPGAEALQGATTLRG